MDFATGEWKKIGRRPLPPEKKRIALGFRVSPETYATLNALAKDRKLTLGKLVDQIVHNEKTRSAEKAAQVPYDGLPRLQSS